ncbi:MAG: T9SS type A sorting domain-containing protein [Crocinitomicaceae bacterium]|nr:T9SS type A sorting domain-containing protein [Crocinitomicaceae bacterium]
MRKLILESMKRVLPLFLFALIIVRQNAYCDPILLSNLEADLELTNVSCNGDCDGSITVNVTSGEAPFTFVWTSLNQGGATVNELCAGNYEVEITDNSGATLTLNATITEPDELLATAGVGHPACYGGFGNISISVTGGTPQYFVDWGGVDNSQLAPGEYNITVSDINQCEFLLSFVVNEAPDQLVYTTQVVPAFESCNGSISVAVSGGVPPYIYNWTGGISTHFEVGDLCGGEEYCVTVVDAAGCNLQICEVVPETALSTASFDLEKNALELFPNPSSGSATLRLSVFNHAAQGLTVFIMNSAGQVVEEIAVKESSDNIELPINIQDSGIYLIKVIGKAHNYSAKLVVL